MIYECLFEKDLLELTVKQIRTNVFRVRVEMEDSALMESIVSPAIALIQVNCCLSVGIYIFQVEHSLMLM